MVGVGCYFIIVLFHYKFVSYDKLSLPHSSGEFQQCASMLLPKIFTGCLHVYVIGLYQIMIWLCYITCSLIYNLIANCFCVCILTTVHI